MIDVMGKFHRLQLEGCDKCGKPAMYEVLMANGLNLRFCGHHWGSRELDALAFMHIKDL